MTRWIGLLVVFASACSSDRGRPAATADAAFVARADAAPATPVLALTPVTRRDRTKPWNAVVVGDVALLTVRVGKDDWDLRAIDLRAAREVDSPHDPGVGYVAGPERWYDGAYGALEYAGRSVIVGVRPGGEIERLEVPKLGPYHWAPDDSA